MTSDHVEKILDSQRILNGNPQVVEIRGKGLMIGIEIDRPCKELVAQALSAGMLINVAAEKTIRLLPPLIISDAEADQIVAGVSSLIQNFAKAA